MQHGRDVMPIVDFDSILQNVVWIVQIYLTCLKAGLVMSFTLLFVILWLLY